ncbi:GDSL-type esterase/lipase family protein [Actinoplanes sp. NPDC049596]|uniref:GDSL-type esterase/lipase family protein n=1 Tax=unclassified Actinoplanes TaxID=2626549 RepID=UPI00343207A7
MIARSLAAALLTLGSLLVAPPAQAEPLRAGPAPIKVMPLGDSITAGGGSTQLDGYRADLRERLISAGLDVDFVGSAPYGASADPDTEGHPGWTIEQVQEILTDRLAAYQPDVILLQLGTNNMNPARHAAAGAPAALTRMLETIRTARPAAQVFVARIPGTAFYGGQWQVNTGQYNAAVPAIVAAAGPRFHLVDQSGIGGLDLADTLHPNNYGYAKMTWNWYRAMERVLRPAGAAPWPAGKNPYTATVTYRCIKKSVAPFARYALGCHTWSKRPVTVYGRTVSMWRTPAQVKTTKRIKVHGRVVTRETVVTKWITGW